MAFQYVLFNSYTNREAITGYATPGTTVQISDAHGNVIGRTGIVAPDRTWSFSLDASHLFAQSGASESFYGIDIDAFGQADPNPYPYPVSVTYTTISPGITITSGGGPISQGHLTISGTVDDQHGSAPVGSTGVPIHILEGSRVLANTSLNTNGTWSATIDLAGDGAHVITALVDDAAGNVGRTSATFTLTLPTPTISIASIGHGGALTTAEAQAGFVISGSTSAEDGQTVIVTVDRGTFVTHAVHGTWSTTVPGSIGRFLAAGDHSVTADVASLAGKSAVEAHAAFTLTSPVIESAPAPATPVATTGHADGHQTNVFRFYDTATNDHFYTTNPAEKEYIGQTLPTYVYENTPWATPDAAGDTMNVYRFYDDSTKDHFYTTSADERDWIVGTLKTYHYEGVAFQAYTDMAGEGRETLERFYNTETHVHHFSASAGETQGILQGAAGTGWIDEGAGFIVHIPVSDIHV